MGGARALIPSDLLLISLQNHGLCSCGALYSKAEYDLETGKTFAVTLMFKTDRGDPRQNDPLWRVRLHNKDGIPKGPRATILQSRLIRHVIESPAENMS